MWWNLFLCFCVCVMYLLNGGEKVCIAVLERLKYAYNTKSFEYFIVCVI